MNKNTYEQQKDQVSILVSIIAVALSLPTVFMSIVSLVNFFEIQTSFLQLFSFPDASIFSIYIMFFLSPVPLFTFVILDDLRESKQK